MDSSTEIEAKFDAPSGWQLPDLDGLHVAELPATELVTVYWDTPDRRLQQWGVTLRRRIADGDPSAEWMVKLPADGDGGTRRRQEVTVHDTSTTPPDGLADLVRGLTRDLTAEPMAELRSHRRRWRVGTDLWSDAVEITDDEVTSTVIGRSSPDFREVEVELLDDGDDGLEVMSMVTAALADSGLEPATVGSKLERVLGPPPSTRPSKHAGSTPKGSKKGSKTKKTDAKRSDGPTLEQLVSSTIEHRLAELVRADPWIRLDDDVEVVHRCRKAVRRLRSDLRTLRPVLKRRRVDAMRDDLKWYGTLLGEVRDLHVLRRQLVDLADDAGVPPVDRDAVVSVLESRLVARRHNLLSAVDGDRYLGLIDELWDVVRRPRLRSSVDPDESTQEVLSGAGRRSWKKVEKAHRRVEDRESPERLHTLRKKTKHVRATAQLAEEAGLSAKKFAKAAGTLKDDLGELHDADVLIDWLDDLPERLEPHAAFSAGRLREHAVGRRSELLTVWPESWDRLDRGRLRRWTR